MNKTEEISCSKCPNATHGFDRNASHNAGRYVCECESHKCPSESLRAKVKELEADQARLNTIANNYSALLIDANQQLSAEQDKVKVLVDALEQIVGNAEECTDADGWMAMVISVDAYHICDEALATVKEEK